MTMPEKAFHPSHEVTVALVERCTRGDTAAFKGLVEMYQSYVFTMAFRIVLEENEALDVSQESFLRVWKHLHRYDPRMKFTTWLYRIVVNMAYDSVRSRQRRRRFFRATDDISEAEGTSSEDMHTQLTNRDLADRIRSLAETLPEKQRLVFVLRDLQDCSMEEVAAVLGMSPNSVKANLCYARRSIRERMGRSTGVGGEDVNDAV